MRTRTIFEALSRVYRGIDWVIPAKRYRQHHTFERELLRRMDHYDRLAPIVQRISDAHFDWVVSDEGRPEADALEVLDAAVFETHDAIRKEILR